MSHQDFAAEHIVPVFDPLGAALFRIDQRGLIVMIVSDGRVAGGGSRLAAFYRPGSVSLGRAAGSPRPAVNSRQAGGASTIRRWGGSRRRRQDTCWTPRPPPCWTGC
jgi:hypothetical protein